MDPPIFITSAFSHFHDSGFVVPEFLQFGERDISKGDKFKDEGPWKRTVQILKSFKSFLYTHHLDSALLPARYLVMIPLSPFL